ncbi:hypothetical protein AKJ57_03260, partial [candidate division MSBL1 archaeon SCGC-AAA259A05]
RETKKSLQPTFEKISNIREKIEDLRRDLKSAEPSEEVHPNVYKSAREAQRLLLKKVSRASDEMEVPSDPDWNSLLNFNRTLQNAGNLLRNSIISHGNQVSALFEGKVDKLRRLTDSLKSLSKELNTALRKRKLELDDFDKFLQDISERDHLLDEEDKIEGKIRELKNRKRKIEEDLNKKESSLESLKKSSRFQELKKSKQKRKEYNRRKKRIRRKINSTISDLFRPLRKMDKMIERDEHMVNREVLDALDMYLDDPVKAVLSESEDLPKLKSMLGELEDLLEDKMKLSDRERKKRLEEVREIIENKKVEKLREKYFRIEENQKELKQERESSSLLGKKNKLEKSIRNKKSELKKLENKIDDLEEELGEIEDQIKNREREIQEKTRSLLNAEIESI